MRRQQLVSLFPNFNYTLMSIGLLIALMLFHQSQELPTGEEEGKRSSHNIMRFGRTAGHNIMRFGRAAGHNIMHFGKRDEATGSGQPLLNPLYGYMDNNNDEGEVTGADYYQLPAVWVSQRYDAGPGRGGYISYPRILPDSRLNKKAERDNVFMHFG